MVIGLPEIEILRRDLEREVAGKKIKEVEVQVAKPVRRNRSRAKFVEKLEGHKIEKVTRIGVTLLLELDEDQILVVEMADGGQLRRHANKDDVDDDNALTITFTQHGQLRLVDHGGETAMYVVNADDMPDTVPSIVDLGIDPVETPMSWQDFAEVLLGFDGELKQLLTNPAVIVGLSDLYADEILFNAGLRFDRTTGSLSAQEIRRLYRAVVETLHDAMKYSGTHVPANAFVDVFGEPGSYQDHLSVWGKDGELSPRSRKPIARTKYKGTWTYYCEQSQV
ncbi:MAG: DNA-formamidopyrimidine glycosylase family protein [Acidimicrobiales bacterium]